MLTGNLIFFLLPAIIVLYRRENLRSYVYGMGNFLIAVGCTILPVTYFLSLAFSTDEWLIEMLLTIASISLLSGATIALGTLSYRHSSAVRKNLILIAFTLLSGVVILILSTYLDIYPQINFSFTPQGAILEFSTTFFLIMTLFLIVFFFIDILDLIERFQLTDYYLQPTFWSLTMGQTIATASIIIFGIAVYVAKTNLTILFLGAPIILDLGIIFAFITHLKDPEKVFVEFMQFQKSLTEGRSGYAFYILGFHGPELLHFKLTAPSPKHQFQLQEILIEIGIKALSLSVIGGKYQACSFDIDIKHYFERFALFITAWGATKKIKLDQRLKGKAYLALCIFVDADFQWIIEKKDYITAEFNLLMEKNLVEDITEEKIIAFLTKTFYQIITATIF